ncbi:MAG: Nif3-like dinuclear metal center hexameric protein, partial [Clostridia bacterium]|nr:Nif3-like dinuclear metal center hexameric protein [Clostridia bacterium]
MITAGQIYDFIDRIAPFETQSEFDNAGLLVGDRTREVTKVIFCLDVTEKAIEEAEEFGAELIISHHPVIFDPLVFVPTKSIIAKAIRKKLTVICAHTNWDQAEGGVSNILAVLLGLDNIRRLSDTGEEAMVYVGDLPVQMTAR